MFDAKKKNRRRLVQLKRAIENRNESEKIGNTEVILHRLSGSQVTAPKLNLVTLLLIDFVLPL